MYIKVNGNEQNGLCYNFYLAVKKIIFKILMFNFFFITLALCSQYVRPANISINIMLPIYFLNSLLFLAFILVFLRFQFGFYKLVDNFLIHILKFKNVEIKFGRPFSVDSIICILRDNFGDAYVFTKKSDVVSVQATLFNKTNDEITSLHKFFEEKTSSNVLLKSTKKLKISDMRFEKK